MMVTLGWTYYVNLLTLLVSFFPRFSSWFFRFQPIATKDGRKQASEGFLSVSFLILSFSFSFFSRFQTKIGSWIGCVGF